MAVNFSFEMLNVVSVGLNLKGPKIYKLFRETLGSRWIPLEIIKFEVD